MTTPHTAPQPRADDAQPVDGPTRGTPAPTTLRREAGTAYFPIAFIARFPFAMMIVGTLTPVSYTHLTLPTILRV